MRLLAKILFHFLLLSSALLCFADTALMLQPPGLRPIQDPALTVPADYLYTNRPLSLPHYRDTQGTPIAGWSQKYVPTRRFNSDQSAWIYYRRQDLQHSVTLGSGGDDEEFCIWPGGTTLVIESYQGNALSRQSGQLIKIDVMAKADTNSAAAGDTFLPAEWSYGRFTSEDKALIDTVQLQECHQCHAIAFRLTGDLVFTRLP